MQQQEAAKFISNFSPSLRFQTNHFNSSILLTLPLPHQLQHSYFKAFYSAKKTTTMPMPMVFTATLKLFLLILLVQNTNSVSHKRGSEKRLVVIQEAHQKWVKHMGSFNHSLSQRGNNKPKPCLRIKVHKNPKKGKFVSVQEAINSLPVVNLCRVVISVSKGIYRYQLQTSHIMLKISLVFFFS